MPKVHYWQALTAIKKIAKINDNLNPELVWGRVEKYNIANYIGVAILLVQPHQNFGINKNEPLGFALRTYKEKLAIIGIVDNEKAKKKPWWKIW